MAGLIVYTCPNCGGDMTFDPNKGDYQCVFCRSRVTQAQMDEETKKQKEKEAAEKAQQEEKKDESGAVVYNCPSCGAQIVTEESTAATFCYYCHNPVILSGRLEGKYTPDYVVPFAIDRNKALGIFSDWIAKKKFVPKSFYNKDQIDKFSGVYFPYLVYNCKVSGYIDAEGKRVERNRIGDMEDITTGIYHVRRDGEMPVKNVSKNALKKANKILVEGVQPFDMKDLKPFNMGYLSGFMAEKRDIEPEELRPGVEAEVKDYARYQLQNSVAGYEDLQITKDALKISDEEWKYALMPVWTVTYKDPHTDKFYYFSMNGQNGKVLGELPVDEGLIRNYFLKIFVPLFVILMLISYFIA